MPKYVRRQPIIERIKTYLNPFDFLLWLSEELDTNGWDELEKEWAIPIGISLNLVFLIARANMKYHAEGSDDVFGDSSAVGWTAWPIRFIVHLLTLFSIVNAIYSFWRRRHYRLFENSIDAVPATPSAQRVRVDSSPVSSSPLRLLSSIIGTESAQARAHPDATRDVWQVAVWDPLPISLRLFCYFSPGHVVVYWLFLPTLQTDPRPSTTIVTTIFLAALLTFQLSILQVNYSRQTKDNVLISKELLHEYDTKFVRPRTQPLYRDVATQFSQQASQSAIREKQYNTVETYTPMTIINRGFKTNPNPNYAQHTDPDGSSGDVINLRHRTSTTSLQTPAQLRESSSPMRPLTAIRQPTFRPASTGGDGGSLGVFSHAGSPLRKSASTHFPASNRPSSDRTNQITALSPEKRLRSPDKRMSVPSSDLNVLSTSQRWGHLKPSRGRRESGRF